MLFRTRTVLAILLTASVGSMALGQTTMAYRFKEGDKLHYLMEQKNTTTMSLAGTDIVLKVNTTVTMSWHVLKVDGKGNASVKVRVTHAKMSMDSLAGNAEVDSNDKALPKDLV